MRRTLALLALAALASCSDSGSSDPPTETSAARELLDAVPLLGVLIADCTESGASSAADAQEDAPETPVPLVELPPVDALAGGDLEQFLVLVELHGDELPIVAGLTSSIEDPTLFVPLPLEDVLALLPPSGLPSDTPVLGSTEFGCGVEVSDASFGLVPVFGGVQSS
ncbi:MAG: hypothetical protein ACREQJ_00190 [Candidatus Binatia bacterium]